MNEADAVDASLPRFGCSFAVMPGRLSTVKTKIKVSPLTDLQMEKIMFFVIPEMPSKTFGMLLKKLPDHFKFAPC